MANSKSSTAQATEPTYELQSLGWKAFQNLCTTIVGEIWGQTVQGFHDSHDGGRDGAFYGNWQPQPGEALEGSFTIQCKFTAKQDKILKIADLEEELAKAERLATRGLSDNYFVFTNARLTGTSEEEIRKTFQEIPRVKHCTVYGVERISQFIRESPRLRMLVPRVYGLGDLSQILDERGYDQAKEILSALGNDLEKFVITGAFKRSARALIEHGFVLLLGEPACGKSTIAAALTLGALDNWGCAVLKIRNADDLVTHSNPHEQKQFFWIDDAFGATQVDWQNTVNWNRVFPHVQTAIKRGAKFVFTSRDYIYRSARSVLKESALPVLLESQVVINVEELTKEEREQILYNHIRLGTQSGNFKSRIKPFLPQIAAHRRFSPEIARRLGDPTFTKNFRISADDVDRFVAEPMDFLQEIIRTLDANSRSAIALIFLGGGTLSSPVKLSPEEKEAIVLLGGTEAEVRNALVALEGSLIIQVQHEGTFSWRFKHPTIREAFASFVAENRELMDIYLMGAPIRRLFSEISCGDVGLEGVKVIVPTDRYDQVLLRIEAYAEESHGNGDQLNYFLANRCDHTFLSAFIVRYPKFISELRVWSYLYAISDVYVIVRLHEFNLLPESERQRHIARIRDLAVDIPDSGFLLPTIASLFLPEEFEEILAHVRSDLLPRLENHVESWRSDYDGESDPEEHFNELASALSDYEEAFAEDEEALSQIEEGLAIMEDVIEELRQEIPPEPEYDSDYYRRPATGTQHEPSGPRSIFDDVDH